MTAEKLAAEWLLAKRQELEATARRLEIEQDLLKMLPHKEEGSASTTLSNGFRFKATGKLAYLLKMLPHKEEGSASTTLSNGFRFKATGKLAYKADLDKLLALTAAWPEKPVKTKVEADEALLRAIRTDRPDLWRQIAPAITVKPAKTYIVIEEPSNGL